jgi:hypothetical protein
MNKDEQRDGFFRRQPAEQGLHLLLRGDRVGVLLGTDAPYVHRGGPALAGESELGENVVHWVMERCCPLLEGFVKLHRDKERSGGEQEEARRRLEE